MEQKQKILSVKELNRYMKMKVESDRVLQDVWIRGEISNFKHHSSGHMYFTMKDETSRIRCIMFASHNARLGFIPKEGSRVIAQGSISIYERDGQYQLYATHMQPDGIGSLYLAFEQLKKKLEDEGLFAQERKRAIPRFPKTVGVITSPTGAAIRDVIITLQRRFPAVPILIYPVLVQGPQAAPSIVKAIQGMNEIEQVDVIIVGRGGGSLEELWAFNEETVARSIAQSNKPIISAVGHETDYTIADFAADLRAATPTAAAELAVPHHMELQQQLHYHMQRLKQGLLNQVEKKKERLKRIQRSPYLLYPRRQLMAPAERLDRLKEQLEYRIQARLNVRKDRWLRMSQKLTRYRPQEQVKLVRVRATMLQNQLLRTMKTIKKDRLNAYQSLLKQLDALSPLKVMQRGYSLTYDQQQKEIIKSIRQVQPGDLIQVKLTDGQLSCQVWSMEGEKPNGNEGA
jgi:exodeoxyribonuclease VII large subunit